MPLDHYVTLGRSGLRVSPFALGAMTFGEDPGGAGTSVEESEQDPGGLPRPRRQLHRHRELLHQRPLREDPRRLLGRPPRPARARRAGVEVLRQHVPRRSQRRRRGPLVDHRPAATRPCAGCRPTTWTCTGCTTGTATPRSRRRCAPSTTSSGAGKVRYIGFSNTPAWVTAQAQTIALLRGWTPLIALQVEYSLLARTVEGEIAPLALDQGMALVPWSPLKNGFLSGKYRRGSEVTDSARTAFVGGPSEDEYVVIDAVAAIADETRTTSAAVALAWLRARAGTVVPIVGARRLDHLEDNLAGAGPDLSAEQLARLDDVSAPSLDYPAPCTARCARCCSSRARRSTASVRRVSAAAAERRALLIDWGVSGERGAERFKSRDAVAAA